MKELNDKLIQRSEKIERMSAILSTAQEGKRARTEDENTEWKRLNEEVKGLTGEIEVLQRQAELDLEAARTQPLQKPEREAAQRFDLSKAITAVGSGRSMDGLELEMHQEASKELDRVSGTVGNVLIPKFIVDRYYNPNWNGKAGERANEQTKTTGLSAGHIPLEVAAPSIIVASPLYREMGATVYEGLTRGKLDLPFSQGYTAAKVAEAGTASQGNPTETKDTLTAQRYHGWQKYTQEYLAESAVMDSMFADMLAAVDRSVGDDLADAIIAANVMTGYATTDTAATIDWAGVLGIISGLTSDSFVREAFLISKMLFWTLAATPKVSGQANFIIDFLTGNNRGKIAGIGAFGTGFLPVHDTNKYDIAYGDMKESFVGFWGGAQLLVDPFSASDDGYTKITYSRLGDTACNPYAFESKRNVSLS